MKGMEHGAASREFRLLPEAPALFPDVATRNSAAAALLVKASRIEREAEDLRSEAMDCDEQARRLRTQAAAMSALDRVDGSGLAMLEDVLEDAHAFAEQMKRRIGQHPMLEPLRSVLVKLDALLDEVEDREASHTVNRAIKPLEALLHERELRAYGERRAA